MDDDRRAHHNELERRRRDHIKDHFTILKDAIPLLDGEKSSRALILKRAVEFIHVMQTKLSSQGKAIEDLTRKNELLEERLLERESSGSPSSSRLPALAVSSSQMQLTMPIIPQMQNIAQLSQYPQQANIIAQSTNPAQLDGLIALNNDAILALLGSFQSVSPSLLDSAPGTPPSGFYPCAFSPVDQQMAVKI